MSLAAAPGEAPWQVALRRRCARPLATPALLAANVLVFAAMAVAGAGILRPDPAVHIAFGANYGPLTLGGEPWRLLSAAFLHFGLLHLAFNSWALWDLGRLVERLYGTAAFLLVYLAAAVAGSAASLAWNPAVNSVGASGAIFGVMGALLAFVLRPRLGLPRAVVAALRRSALVFTGLSLGLGALVPGIDNAAHLGGLVAGALLGLVLARPLDPAAGERGAGLRLAAALAVAFAVLGPVVGAVCSPPPALAAEAAFLRDVRAIAALDLEVTERLQALAREARDGRLDDGAFSARVARELLPRWREARTLALAHPPPPGSRQAPLAAALGEYVAARGALLELLAAPQDPRDAGARRRLEAAVARERAAAAAFAAAGSR